MMPSLTPRHRALAVFVGLLWLLGGAARPAHAQDPPTEPVTLEPAVVGAAAPAEDAAGGQPVGAAAGPAGPAGGPDAGGQIRGIMVRLETTTVAMGGDASVKLVPVGGGDTIELELLDNGNSPDVQEGDGIYAGASIVDADAFDVTLTVDGKVYEGGEISWDADAGNARDLVIRLVGDEITLTAAQPGPSAVTGPTDPSGGGPTPPTNPAAGAVAGPAGPAGGSSSVSRSDAMLWLAIGVGLVVLAGAGLVASRWMGGRGGDGPDPVGEPGLFGAGTPSLTDKPAWWVVEGEDASGLRDALLQSVARQHRVLVVSPAGQPVPRVLGGPGYHVEWDADSTEDAAFALVERDGPRLVAVLWAPDTNAATVQPILGALPDDVGAMVVVPSVPQGIEAAVVRLRQTDSGVVLDTSNGAVPLQRIGTALEALGRA